MLSSSSRRPFKLQTSFKLLPHEIVSVIFSYSLPDIPSYLLDSAPLSLTHVSRRFRHIALATHGLWTKIHVTRAQATQRHIFSLIFAWLARSQARPLDVNIDILEDECKVFYVDEYHQDRKFYREIIGLLRPHRRRIRTFRGMLPGSVVSEFGLDGTFGVRELELAGVSELSMTIRGRPLRFGNLLPEMTKLSVQNLGFEVEGLFLQTQLTRLELTDLHNPANLSPQVALNILRALPRLAVCALELSVPVLATPRSPICTEERYPLPALSWLFMHWDDTADAGRLLDCISAPNLARLGLRGTPHTSSPTWDPLLNFLLASQAPLTRLSLGDMSNIDINLLNCLRLTPSIRRLTVNHGYIDAHFLRALTWDDNNLERQILPNLELFRLGACPDFETFDILPMLKSRVCAPNHPIHATALQEVVLRSCIKLRSEDKRHIMNSGVPRIIMDIGNSVFVPLAMGMLPFVRVVESHQEFFSD